MLARIRKAIMAGVGAGVAAYTSALASGKVDVNTWITVVGSVIVIGVITYLVPNAPTPPRSVSVTDSRAGINY